MERLFELIEEQQPLLKVSDVVYILNISRSHCYELIEECKIDSIRTGKKNGIRVCRESLIKFITNNMIDTY